MENWKAQTAFHFSTPRLRRRRIYNPSRCATLTIEVVQKIGQATLTVCVSRGDKRIAEQRTDGNSELTAQVNRAPQPHL
jgi:hypothetical protein